MILPMRQAFLIRIYSLHSKVNITVRIETERPGLMCLKINNFEIVTLKDYQAHKI